MWPEDPREQPRLFPLPDPSTNGYSMNDDEPYETGAESVASSGADMLETVEYELSLTYIGVRATRRWRLPLSWFTPKQHAAIVEGFAASALEDLPTGR